MAKNVSTAKVVIMAEGKQAKEVMNDLLNRAKSLKDEIAAIEKSGIAPNDSKLKDLQGELKRTNTAINQNKNAFINLADIVDNLSGTKLGRLQMALKECRKQMNGLSANDKDMKTLISQYKAIDNQIGKITGQWKRQDGALKSVMKRLTAYVGIYGVFNMLKSQVQKVVQGNLAFSDSLSDIRKTTKLSEQDVNALSDAINKIDSRNGREQLHLLAYEAGKLGLGKYGAQGVLGFVKSADQLSVAMKGVLGDDGILQITKMGEVMGLFGKMGVEKSMLALGSSINELAQNSTAKGTYIADFARRVSGIGLQAHMSAAEIMGLGGAADALQQELEVSATAMNKFIVQLQAKHKTVAKAVGIDEDYLRGMLEQGKTTEAMIAVFEKLKGLGGLSPLAPLMKDLGSDGARLTAVLSAMVFNVDKVKEMIDISTGAFKQATSVTNEYNLKNENAAAIMERMKNSWDKMFVNSGNVGVVKEMAEDIADLSHKLQTNQLLWWELKVAMQMLILAFKGVIALIPYLTIFLSVKGFLALATAIVTRVYPAVISMIGSFKAMFIAATTATAGVNGTRRALIILNGVLKSNIFVALASIVLSLAFAFKGLKKEISEVQKSAENLDKSFKDYNKTSSQAIIQSNQLFAKLKNTAKGTKEHRDALRAINDQYKKYLPQQLTEASNLGEIEAAQKRVNDQLRRSLALKAQNSAMDEVGIQYTNKMADRTSAMQELYNRAGGGTVGKMDIDHIVEFATKYRDQGKTRYEAGNKIWEEMFQTSSGQYSSGMLYQMNDQFKMERRNLRTLIDEYISLYYDQQKAIADVKNRYQPLIGDYMEQEDEAGGPYSIIEPGKDGEAEKQRRSALKAAKDEADAVMSAIEVYYKQQEQFINEQYIAKKLTAEQRQKQLDENSMNLIATQEEARWALMDKPNRWNAQLQALPLFDMAQTEESAAAIQNLVGKNLKEIGDRLRMFGDGEMDGIWNKLQEGRLKVQKLAIDLRSDMEKILLQYDYTGKVDRQFRDQLEKLNLFFIDYTKAYEKGAKDVEDAAMKGMGDLGSIAPSAQFIDIDTEDGQAAFRQMLREQETFSEEMINLKEDELKVLYYKTIEYYDATTEAQRKANERQLKIAKERYKLAGREQYWKDDDAKNKNTVDIYGSAKSIGLASDKMVQDQEVIMYQRRLEAAMEYYDYLKAHGKPTEEAMMDVEQAAANLSEKLVAQTSNKLGYLKNYTDAIETFGTEAGAVILDETATMESAITNMLKAMGEATNKIIMDWVKQKLEHGILRAAMMDKEDEYQDSMSGATKKGSKSTEKIEKTAAKAALKRARQFGQDKLNTLLGRTKSEENIEEQSQDAQTTLATEGATAVGNALIGIGQETVLAKKTQAVENVGTAAAETSAEVPLGIAAGASKTIGELGWWGIPLVAVISALLGGLLSMAMGKVSSAFGSKTDSAAGSQAKLVTGMLTYDSGNVQRFGGKFPVLGDDGRIYNATQKGELGTGLVTHPTATTIGGQPALVGERGPEMVIGRETTAAMMMSRPDLLNAILNFDRNHSAASHRTYDAGNVSAFGGGTDPALLAMLAQMSDMIAHNAEVNSALQAQLDKGISATLNKWGRGGLMDEVSSGNKFSKRHSTSTRG